jgi:predicted phosphodiesterase
MRIAVIADIHGNVIALEAVLDDLARRGGADLIVDLGDCVSGPLWPAETFARLEKLGAITVRGNHDRRVALDPAEGIGPSDSFARERLTQAQLDRLAALPLTAEPAPSVLAFHAGPDHDESYLTEIIADGRLIRALVTKIEKRLGSLEPAHQLLLFGHSHRPELLRLTDGRILFNPGSVGCPAYSDDTPPAHVSEAGSSHARYGLVQLDAWNAVTAIDLFAVAYDNEAAARRADDSGRPEWAHALRTGFMPGHAS